MSENPTQKEIICHLMDDMLTRIEAKQYEETEIKNKIMWMRNKKNKGKPQTESDELEVLHIFQTNRIKREE